MSSVSEKWTSNERHRALKAFFESEEASRFLDIFSSDNFSNDDLEVFIQDAERRYQFYDEAAYSWWNSLSDMVKDTPHRQLALAEPLAQYGIDIEDIYRCLPENFDSQALIQAINYARKLQVEDVTHGITSTAGLTDEEINRRLDEVKSQLDFANASKNALQWWEDFERESQHLLSNVLRLAEELVNRKATVTEFFDAFDNSGTENIQAVLHYLEYTRLKQDDKQTVDSDWWLRPAPGATRVRGWSDDQILSRLEKVKERLDWKNTSGPERQWWDTFEQKNQQQLAFVLRLVEELANRKATINDFYRAFCLSNTTNIQANLHFLNYSRLKETISLYEYETVQLDETGVTRNRHRQNARQFIEELAPGINLEMVEIPGGKFMMGSLEQEIDSYESERPQHEVTIAPFYMGKYPITQEQWAIVAGWAKVEIDLKPEPSNFKGRNRPVEQISWHEAKEFCERLTRRTGRKYRLASESEWEYACRAGTMTPFAFGETITPEIVNYNGNYPYAKAKKGKYRQETTPVGSLGVANAFGLYDMHGNVWEWCEDEWHKNYEGAPDDGSAWLSGGDSSNRVLRGGSWGYLGSLSRSAGRSDHGPAFRDLNFGFRVVVGARTS